MIRAELPGVDPDRDVELKIVDGVLRITAHREERADRTEDETYRTEFRYGTFVRNVVLPPGVREEDVKASFKDGVLEIRIPANSSTSTEETRIPIEKN